MINLGYFSPLIPNIYHIQTVYVVENDKMSSILVIARL
jgi:hypothetical protein